MPMSVLYDCMQGKVVAFKFGCKKQPIFSREVFTVFGDILIRRNYEKNTCSLEISKTNEAYENADNANAIDNGRRYPLCEHLNANNQRL